MSDEQHDMHNPECTCKCFLEQKEDAIVSDDDEMVQTDNGDGQASWRSSVQIGIKQVAITIAIVITIALTFSIGVNIDLTPPPVQEDSHGSIYIVRPNDTLYSIAREHDISVIELELCNDWARRQGYLEVGHGLYLRC